MNQNEDIIEAKRWLDTAEGDFQAARYLITGNLFAQSCFHSQQAGEKAVKAIWFFHGKDPWGHSIQKLYEECVEIKNSQNDKSILFASITLDKYYISTRYPDSLPDLTPNQVYQIEDANLALTQANLLIGFARKIIYGKDS